MRWAVARLLYATRVPRRRRVLGHSGVGDLAVVICLWKRTDRVPQILDMLAAQTCAKPLRVIFWNNDRRRTAQYCRQIASHGSTPDHPLSVELHSSPANVGGMGRFLAMRSLTKEGYTGPFVTLDDDQDVSITFIDDLTSSYAPCTFAGSWAFWYDPIYYERRALSTGEAANYVGTGGAICDSRVTISRLFFTALPRRFFFVEDLWLSAYVARQEWDLRKIHTEIEFVLPEFDQHHAIFDLKTEFSMYLAQAVIPLDPSLSAPSVR
jgi:hypothetical protein